VFNSSCRVVVSSRGLKRRGAGEFPRLFMAFVLCAVLSGNALEASSLLQTANNTTGNQAFSGVGVVFQVNSEVVVSELGVFDSNLDGIAASPETPLSAYLFSADRSILASQTFDNESPGTLSGAYRFKSITPLTLLPGQYVLVGYGWTSSDLEHNCFVSGSCDTFNDGGGELTFLSAIFGGGSDSPGTVPTAIGTLNYFSSANMIFSDSNSSSSSPEPSTLLLLCAGLLPAAGRRLKALVLPQRIAE
jgi:hypothetical protein